jgi:putative ABC transport system permease protein
LGEFFTQADVDHASPVCVLGQTIVDNLFALDDPIGKVVRVQGLPCQIVGVLRAKGLASNGQDQDDFVVLPYTTVAKRVTGTFWLDDIFCSAISTESMQEATKQITALLRERHHLNPGEDDDFNVRRPEDVIQAQLASRQIMRLLLASIASLSLIVGGIGILGGVLGMTIGFFCSGLVSDLFHFPTELTMNTFLFGAGFAAGVAVIFGYYPAKKASQLDPIQALRYE